MLRQPGARYSHFSIPIIDKHRESRAMSLPVKGDSVGAEADQHGLPVFWRGHDAQTLNAADFVLVPAVVLLVGFCLIRPPGAVFVLRQPARPGWDEL